MVSVKWQQNSLSWNDAAPLEINSSVNLWYFIPTYLFGLAWMTSFCVVWNQFFLTIQYWINLGKIH